MKLELLGASGSVFHNSVASSTMAALNECMMQSTYLFTHADMMTMLYGVWRQRPLWRVLPAQQHRNNFTFCAVNPASQDWGPFCVHSLAWWHSDMWAAGTKDQPSKLRNNGRILHQLMLVWHLTTFQNELKVTGVGIKQLQSWWSGCVVPWS